MNEKADDPKPQPLSEDLYISTRQDYDHAELEVSGRYDTWILTLTGGALGLTLTFMEKIAPTPFPDTLIWLKFSWACLVAALLAALVSLVTSQSAIRENRKELDKANEEGRAPSLSFPRWFTIATDLLNWISLVLFIVGVTLLCVFSFKNIGGSQNQKGDSYVQGTNTGQATNYGGIRPSVSTTTRGNQGVCAPITSKNAQATTTQTTVQVIQTRIRP